MCSLAFVMADSAALTVWDFALGGVLMAVLLFLGVVVAPWVRRKYHPSNIDDSPGGSCFDIEHLEKMHRDGLITKEEFRSLRHAALGLDIAGVKADNSTLSAPTGGDDEESEVNTADAGQQADADECEPEQEL